MRSLLLALVVAFATFAWAAPGVKVVNKHNKPVRLVVFSDTTENPHGRFTSHVVPHGKSQRFPSTPASKTIWVSEDQDESRGAETLIEHHFDDYYATIVYDVSHVDAYTLPVVCGCELNEGSDVVTYVNGCNLDLYALHECPKEDQTGWSCANPTRHSLEITEASPFFKPCEHAAFTFPSDGLALDNRRECADAELITCCVGTACPRSLRQIEYQGPGNGKPDNGDGDSDDGDSDDDDGDGDSDDGDTGGIWCTRGEPICETKVPHCNRNHRDCEDDGYCRDSDLECKANWEEKKEEYNS